MPYESYLKQMLDNMPEFIETLPKRCAPAFNVVVYKDHYSIAFGERVGDEFIKMNESESRPMNGINLATIAEKELEAVGENGVLLDVFLDGKLHREASL